MRKRGAVELFVFAVIALVAVGVLFFDAKTSATGMQSTRLRTVPRTEVPQQCQQVNSLMVKITRDIEAQFSLYEDIYARIKLLLNLKAKVLQITNTKLKTAVLTCRDWYRLVPGLDKVIDCDEIDRVYDEERGELVAEGKTCSDADPRCEDVFPWKACGSGPDGGDQSVSCACEPVKTETGTVDRCVPREDPQLWVFQKNVWTLKKILLKLKLELEAEYERWREIDIKIKDHLEAWIKLDGQLKDCLKKRCVTDCPETPRTVPRDQVTTPREPVAQYPQPRDRVTGPQPTDVVQQPQKSCEEVCAENGMSTRKPTAQDLLARVQGEVCVSGARAQVSGKRIGSCTCYGELQVSIDRTPPVCPPGRCGKEIPCNGQVTCQEGNTKITERCTWKGWEIRGQSVAPIVGGVVLEI